MRLTSRGEPALYLDDVIIGCVDLFGIQFIVELVESVLEKNVSATVGLQGNQQLLLISISSYLQREGRVGREREGRESED